MSDDLEIKRLEWGISSIRSQLPYSMGMCQIIEGASPLAEVRNTLEAAHYKVDRDTTYSDSVLYSFIMVACQMDKTNPEPFDTSSLRYLAWSSLMLNHIHTHKHPEDLYNAQ